jgi:dephospho-CoA kinase
MPPSFRVGLTGGVGSGKSTVAALFAGLGVPVVDADQVAREVVEPGESALAEVVTAFGASVLDAGGRLDRAALRARVFANPGERARLEAILHPRIRARMEARAAALEAPYCILCVPLLVEARDVPRVDRVLVVDVPEALQVARVAARDGLDAEAARAMIAAQAPRAARLAAADDVIVNDGPTAALAPRVEALHALYLGLARARLRPAGGWGRIPGD